MAWNISKAKRRALVALQLRDKNGRFIEMGKGVKWYSTKHKSVVSGVVEDGKDSRAAVRMTTGPDKGRLVYVEASQIEVIESKASLKPQGAPAAKSGDADASAPSATIPNPKDDPDYDATMEKYGDKEGEFKPLLSVSKTPDGNTYITAPEGAELYTPAKELAVGDEIIAPDGADPKKPFSMGKAWPTKNAERVNTAGPKIGKVLSIKEHAYAVVQLPEGETVESTQKPGEQTNTVTVGLSNKVIKATPELKAALKDVIPEPVYSAPEAPAPTAEADEKKAKRLDLLKKSPAGTTLTAKDDSIQFTKGMDGKWTDGSGVFSDEEVNSYVEKKQAETGVNGAQPLGFSLAQDTSMEVGEVADKGLDGQELLKAMYDGFEAELTKAPSLPYALAGKDEAFGGFDGFNHIELGAIQEYVGSSVETNLALRKGGDIQNPKVAETILAMDSILNRSALKEDSKVFRGVGANAEMVSAMLNNGVMRDRAFSSTSVDEDFAKSWVANTGLPEIVPVVMEIDLPKGFKAHKVDYTSVGGGFEHENEVVLPRDLEFDITHVEEYTNESGKKGYRVKATPILNENNYATGEDNDGTAEGTGGDTAAPATTEPAGSGDEQGGQVHVDSGSGDVPESGGSGTEEAAEPSPEEEDGNGPLASEAPKTPTAPIRRNRETIMAELQPIDTSGWKKVGEQAGSNPGGVFEDENGQQWYVKQSKSDAHARAEVLADQLYKATGIDSSGLKLTTFNGKMGTASPMIEGAKTDLFNKYSDKAYMDKIREGFAVDAWLANWDVLGLEDDNIVTDANGNPVRIDTGGTMMFRAQGGLKNEQQPGAWGNEVKDWDGLRQFGTAPKVFKDITDQQLVDSAARVEAVTPEEIDAMVEALGYKGGEAVHLANTLKARRKDIIRKAAALNVEKSSDDSGEPTTSESSAPAPKLIEPTDESNAPSEDEPFEPVLPSANKSEVVAPQEQQVSEDEPFEPILPSSLPKQEKPKKQYPKATTENPNVLQDYTIEQNERGVYYPKERLSISAWQGLRNGTIVPPNLPFIPFNTNSGEVHYWDSTGVRHWGQFGGEGAFTRRKNADGEYEYLLAQRSSTLSTSPNMWSTPGGAHMIKSDSEANGITAKIELEEELGLELNGEPVASYKHSTAPDWGYNYAIFDAPEGAEVSLEDVDRHEIQDLKWMTADQIKELRDNGQLQSNMAEVLDDILNASESAQSDDDEASTSPEDSDAPEAPSQAAEDTSSTDEEDPDAALKAHALKFLKVGPDVSEEDKKFALDQAVSTLKMLGVTNESVLGQSNDEPSNETTEASTVQTDGPSVTMADGKQAFVGSRVAHKTKGTGKVIQIIAGKSAKIEFDDGTTKISQAHLISSFDKEAASNEPLDVSDMAPGDIGNNPANGKLFIVSQNNQPIYVGDKVEAMHKGEVRSGTVKGIYKTINSLGIVFDGDSKPTTKKAAVTKSLEEQATPVAPEDTNAPKYNDSGFTAAEQKQVDELEAELAKGWTKEVSDKLDALYEKGDARLDGKDVPEDSDEPAKAVEEEAAPVEEVADPEAVEPEVEEAPEETPEEAPEAEQTPALVEPDEVPEEAPTEQETNEEPAEVPFDWDYVQKIVDEAFEAPAGSKLVSKKLGESWTKSDTGVKWSNDETGEELYPDTIIGGGENSTDWEITSPEESSPAKGPRKDTALSVPAGSALPIGNSDSSFVKNDDGTWEMFINDLPTGVTGTTEQVQKIADTTSAQFKIPSHLRDNNDSVQEPEAPAEESLAEWEKELFESPETAPEAPEEPKEPELADWEKELLGLDIGNNFDDYESIDYLMSPSGLDLDGYPAGTKIVTSAKGQDVWTKQPYSNSPDEGATWTSDNGLSGDMASSYMLADGSDAKILSLGEEGEQSEGNDSPESPENSVAKSFPVGTKIGDPNHVHYLKEKDDFWSKYNGSVEQQEMLYDSEMDSLMEENPDYYDPDFPTLPESGSQIENALDEIDDVLKNAVALKLAGMPVGTTAGPVDEGHYRKVAPNEWQEYYGNESTGYNQYNDQEMSELVTGVPEKYGYDKIVVPDGSEVPEPEADTFDGLSKEEFAKLPVGTKIDYSATADPSNVTGTYEKAEDGTWQYTPKGSEVITHKNISEANFDHFFTAGVSSEHYKISSAAPEGEPVEDLPKVDTGVQKHVYVASASQMTELPTGTTVKPEKHSSYWSPNNTYYQKQADGTWQEFKKTPNKLMKGPTYTDFDMYSKMGNVTISKPLSDDYFISGFGEIGYVGDKVMDGSGEVYTVDKILKTALNVTSSSGEKLKKKHQDVKKDNNFAKPEESNYSYGYGIIDPLTQSSNDYAKKAHEELVAKQKAEQAANAIKVFAGGSAEEFDKQGLTMLSNPSPKLDTGLKLLEVGEPDMESPLYGTPKPTPPTDPGFYPSFNPPAMEPLPKWDSAEWLAKVEQRYLDNPNKAKPTVQESNNWSLIQQAMGGDKSAVDSLLSKMYLTEEMHKEAIEAIEAKKADNASLIEAHDKKVAEAKAEYEAKKSEDLASYNSEKKKYDENLAEWIAANPSADALREIKKPAVSKTSFEGGEADWTKAHIGTYTAKDAMDAIAKDNLLGRHGLSVAVDSDQIEDLDVKMTKVLNSAGAEKLEMKFKLTAPHGKAMAAKLDTDPSVSIDDNGIYPTKMALDKTTGLLKDIGKPASKYVNSGKRYSFNDPETGATIVFQKASFDDGVNVSSNDNTFKIHMPVDSTPEQFQKTLENLGIAKARPSTAGDIRVLAENKLISLMGEHSGAIKTYDGRVNMTGDERKKALDKIASEYGITPDDMTFSTEPNGRVRFSLSDEKAEEFAKKYNVSYFQHRVSGYDDPDLWVAMMTGVNPGLLSTFHRHTEGIGGDGSSSDSDMGNGSGDYIYLTPQKASSKNSMIDGYGGGQVIVKPNSIFKRTDFWANPGDGWGKKATDSDTSHKSPYKLFDQQKDIAYGGHGYGVYEVLPKDSVPLSDWAFVTMPSYIKKDVIKKLTEMGVLEINGLPLDKFIVSSGDDVPVDLTEAGSM
jgi:isopentenyldiphosphate isomerase